MKRFTIVILLAFVLILGLVPGAGLAETAKNVTLKVQSSLPTRLPLLDTIHFFAEKAEAASGGNISVKVYDPGKLVPPFEIHDAVSTGQINAGYTASVYVSGKIRAANLFTTIPFGPSMTEYLSWFYEGNGLKLYQEMYDQNGYNVKVFPLYIGGMEGGGWFRKPINSAADLKGLRLRWPGLGGKVLSKLGASVSTIPGSEIFPSLEKGAIDGTEFGPPVADTKVGFWKVAPYSYFPGWHQTSTVLELLINKKTWNNMSKGQQTLIELTVLASNARLIGVFEALEGKTIKENAEKHSVKNMIYPDDVLKLLQKTWLEVVAEECAKDTFFKKVWDDLSAFRADYQVWECHSTWAMPKPECK
jgi:TRAP-type mannitol/chloroaromatic compound transport system substrate-binding protein